MLSPSLGAGVFKPVPSDNVILIERLRAITKDAPVPSDCFARAARAIDKIKATHAGGAAGRYEDAMSKNHFDFKVLRDLDDDINRALLLAALMANPLAAAALWLGKEAGKSLANAAVGAAEQAAKEAAYMLTMGTLGLACKGASSLCQAALKEFGPDSRVEVESSSVDRLRIYLHNADSRITVSYRGDFMDVEYVGLRGQRTQSASAHLSQVLPSLRSKHAGTDDRRTAKRTPSPAKYSIEERA